MEENGSAAILAAKRSAGVAPEVKLKEGVTHMCQPSMNKAAHPGFGVSVSPQKGLVSTKIKKIQVQNNLIAFTLNRASSSYFFLFFSAYSYFSLFFSNFLLFFLFFSHFTYNKQIFQGGHGTGKTENREFGSYFFQTGKTQGILL